uniref:Fibronectin type-III domain-containing protein n=1 Tax=Catharus ustulatus TaxID=91951 RepID=A0A8C3TTL2_CATUS
MMSRFICLLFCGYIALDLGNTQKLPRVKRQSLKVQINATDDTVCMRYLRPSQSTKLEGFVLGYGSNFFSNQYIPLPAEGKNYITELDAEPRYLVSVRPARVSNNKKSCSGRNKTQKPLQLVVGTLSPTSVFLSWGILVNPQHDWTATSNCGSDRFYTVRYREKGKDKKWVFQLCPATETVIDNLKPNTPYEFGVKDNAEDSIWSKTLNHKTVLSSKYLEIVNQKAADFESIFSSIRVLLRNVIFSVFLILWNLRLSNNAVLKSHSVTTSPGPQHPPIPPARPTQMRRKPLPPNTVTGKPGSPAPHVKYMKKDDDVPCSITSSLEHFPQEEVGSKEEPTRPPQNPPTNLTVVTVEGCPSFVILDWEKPDNDTVTEYEVVSTENGGTDGEKEKSIITTNQTHSTVENLKPDTSYEFHVKPRNPLGEGPSSNVVAFSTESADPRVSEPISMGKDAIWTEIPFNSDTYSECKGKQYVKRTWYKKFVGVQLCNSLRYKIYLSDSLTGKFYNIGDQRGHGEDHCQFVDSFLDGRTGQQEDLPVKDGFFRAVRQEPVKFGKIGGETQINYVRWYECGTSIPGKW